MSCWKFLFLFAVFNIEHVFPATVEDIKDHAINFSPTNKERTSSSLPKPKMLAEEIIERSGLEYRRKMMSLPNVKNIQSKAAIFTGYCSSESPFEFTVGGKFGRGVIGTPSAIGSEDILSAVTSVEIADPDQSGKKDDRLQVDEGGLSSEFFLKPGFVGLPFVYAEMTSPEGTLLRVRCSDQQEAVDIVVFVEDKHSQVIEASVTYDPSLNAQLVDLMGAASMIDLHAESITPISKQKDAASSLLTSSAVEGSSTSTSITLFNEQGNNRDSSLSNDVKLVQIIVEDADGFLVPKTLTVTSSGKIAGVSNTIILKESSIDKNGDINLKFEQLADNEVDTTLLHARIGISYSQCGDERMDTEIKDVVDMKAMLYGNEPALIVHGGWFRRATEKYAINNDDECKWEPILIDAITEDPNNDYITIGHLESPVSVKVMDGDDGDNNGGLRRLSSNELKKRRNLLRAVPSPEEVTISEDMRQGRNPKRAQSIDGENRRPPVNRKKILVHGWCSGSVWYVDDFTNAALFEDYGENRRNDEFALMIYQFALDNNIDSCGIIAHSQGGMAALHLFNYYWSCLDEAQRGGEHLIQSIGTPYRGTPLQGNLAAIGDIFGILCGENYDLTTDGADAWLSGIYYEARAQVYYGTTSVKDEWFSIDYCSLGSDFFLDDPEDGVVEKSKGQLDGGNNLGHAQGYCHTSEMNNPSQTGNSQFNSYFNRKAKY